MFNSLRTHQYLNDFIKLIDLYYKYEYRIIRTNYYLFDWKLSVYDKEVLRYGAYERIGDLTGYRWIKIYYFPVAFSQQAIPATNPTEYGVNKETETNCVFPKINFVPTMLDFVTFYLYNNEVEAVYQVSGYEISYIGNQVPIYKVTLKMQAYSLDEIMNQVNGEFVYCEISDKIYDPPVYNQIIDITASLQDITLKLQETKESSSGLNTLDIGD